MKLHKKKLCQLIGATLAIAGQNALANNGDQMVGYSGLSNAMGGAVVATPQDVTTSLSNPAGLSFLNMGPSKTRFDMNVGLLNPIRTLNGVESDNSLYVMATGGFAFESERFPDRLTVGIGAYPVSGGGVDFPKEAFPAGGGVSVVASRQSLRIGPAAAYRVTDDFSLGMNLSLVSNTMSLKGPGGMDFPSDVAYGWAGVLGATWQMMPSMRLGAAYTTRSYTEDLEWNTNTGRYSLAFEDPQTFALGLSFQSSEKWLIEADVKYMDFKRVRDNIVLDGPGANDRILAMGWDSQWIYALGTRYQMSEGSRILAGWNYGKSPIKEEDLFKNLGVTAIVEHHLSLGGEFDVSKNSTISLSWIHGFKNDMSSPAKPGTPPEPATSVSFETNLVTLQFTYRH